MDTAASKHFVTNAFSVNARPSDPIHISQPDGSELISDRITNLQLSDTSLPLDATEANIIPTLTDPLVSIGQLCNHDCVAVFRKHNATVYHDGEAILQGHRNYSNGLWYCNIPHPKNYKCNKLHPTFTVAQRVAYYHACLGSPPLSTFCHAIDAGHLVTFPTLTSTQVRRHPPQSMATHQGHLDQTRSNQRSTKRRWQKRDLFIGLVEDMESPTTLHRAGTTFSDITGKFIMQSSQGNNYILVVFDGDSNYIFAEPLPSRTAEQIVKAYNKIHQLLINRGLEPRLHITDNETSAQLKQYLTSRGVQYQLVPPNNHRANAAERAIRTFKNHFIATLCSCDMNFPLQLWDRLIEQAVITLNILRKSSINERLSAYAQVHGVFDFNTTPLGPPGTKVLVHERPNNRGTWSPHGTEGWYIGPAMDHYRSFKIYIPSTNDVRVSDTLAWFPSHVTMPRASSADMAMASAYDLTQALLHPSPASALSPFSDIQRHALIELAKIFGEATGMTFTDPSPGTPDIRADEATEQRVEDDEAMMGGDSEDDLDTRMENDKEDIEPRVDDIRAYVEPRMNNVEVGAEPRVNAAPISTPIEPTAPVNNGTQPSPTGDPPRETTYSSYNHNGPQRRRKAKHNRRHRNPVVVPPTPQQDQTADQAIADAETLVISNVSPIPSVAQDPQSVTLNETTNTTTRRPRRGIKVVRFDPKTHRMIPSNFTVNALTAISQEAQPTGTLRLSRLLKGPDAAKWERASTMEFGRVAQGFPGLVEGTDTIRFIRFEDKPPDRICSYCRPVCAYNENKEEKERVRLTYGGDKSDYPFDVSTPTVDISTFKIHLNSIISTPDARHMTMDLKNFFLYTPLQRKEYMKIPLRMIPQAIIDHYNLMAIAVDGYVMTECNQGIYGLPQAGKLANELLKPRLAAGGYHPAPNTPGLYIHESRKISFCLWVDDFSVKYVDKADVQHLIDLLKQYYELTTDWTGTKYLGMTLRWDYKHRTVDLSMPGYIERALQRFNHPTPDRPQHSPHAWTAPQYGSTLQMTEDDDESAALSPPLVKRLQEIIGVLLFYARMVDNTMLVAIATLASAQAKATEATMQAAVQLLNYAATHPNATIRFSASDMILHIVSDASYLSASEARSRLGGYFFMSQQLQNPTPSPEDPSPPFNGPVLVNSSIIQPVCSSAAEAEFAALFHNARDGCMLRNTLEDMGHPQPATPIQADNSCAVGLANNTIKQKRSKAINMRFYWIRDRVKDGQFIIYWKKGSTNDADYFTKHHPPSVHRRLRPRYLLDDGIPTLVPAVVT
jgi:hypothetical protein